MRFRSVVVLAAASFLAACSSTPPGQTPVPQTNESADRMLRVGETVTGSITESDPTWGGNGRFDAYRFQASEGDRVLILLQSEDFDPYLVVGTESGGIFDPLEQNDDAGNELNSRIRFTAPRTGTYRILAQAYADYGLGTYQLSLQPYVPAPVETSSIAIGSSVDAFLDDQDNYDEDEESHYDEYVFQAEAGRRYSVTMTSEDFDSYLLLGTGSGEDFAEIARNDDSGAGYDSRIQFTADATGPHTVRATSYGGASAGAYTIQVAEAAAPGPMVVTPLSLGRTVSGTLEDGDQIAEDGSFYDVYSFSGRQGDRVEIVMRSDELDSYVEVGEPAAGDEFFAEYSDDDSAGDLDARIRITLPRDGEYHVRALSLYPEETGSYTISFGEPSIGGSVRAQEIRIGQILNGSLEAADPLLDDGSYYDVFTFEGRAGQRIRVTLRSDDFDSFLQFGPWTGSDIDVTDYDDDSGEGTSGLDSMLELTLPENGTYAIMVNTVYPEETGAYAVELEEQ